MIVSAPYLDHVPNSMYFSRQASSESIDAIPNHTSKEAHMYYLNFSSSYNLLNTYTRENGKYVLDIPISNPTQKSIATNSTNSGLVSNKNFSVSIIPSSNPVVVNQTVTFYSIVQCGKDPYTYSWYVGGGSYNTKNETSDFYFSGNYSIELVVTDANGQKTMANYTEKVLVGYPVYINSHYIGNYSPLNPQLLIIKPSVVAQNNYLNITENFSLNHTITLYFYMPSNIPTYVIFNNSTYIAIGLFSGIISFIGLIYIIRKMNT